MSKICDSDGQIPDQITERRREGLERRLTHGKAARGMRLQFSAGRQLASQLASLAESVSSRFSERFGQKKKELASNREDI